jgi:type IV pilus assembly protein PilE
VTVHAPKQMRGVTLIELMITVVIISILATLAVPSYRHYILRSQRTDAMTALTRIQAAQEKYFLQYNQYTTSLTGLPPAGLALPAVSDNGFYDIDMPEATAVAFTVRAVPRDGQAQDTRCQVFSLDHNNIKHAADGSGTDTTAECWR